MFWPCWQLGDPRTVEPLAAVLAADDADAVVIQHQPGLMHFRDLARLVSHPVLDDRVVVVTLHNTRDLLDLSEADHIAVTGALARADRLLVHTPADVERLRDLGLARNVALLPHGVAPPLPVRPARALRPDHAAGPLIGCYGFFLPGKGIDVLIEAASRLRGRWPTLRLLLVNAEYDADASRDEIRRCRQLADTLGLADHVAFDTAFLPQAQSLDRLAACDVPGPAIPAVEGGVERCGARGADHRRAGRRHPDRFVRRARRRGPSPRRDRGRGGGSGARSPARQPGAPCEAAGLRTDMGVRPSMVRDRAAPAGMC